MSTLPIQKLKAGDVINYGSHALTIKTLEFERHGAFWDAVAQAECSTMVDSTHVSTPWGMVMVVTTQSQYTADAMCKEHYRVSRFGKKIGTHLSALADKGCAALIAEGVPDERCASCAFRAGTVPNGCEQTQLDAFKALAESVPFVCHATSERKICSGYLAAAISIDDEELKEMGKACAKYAFSNGAGQPLAPVLPTITLDGPPPSSSAPTSRKALTE